MCYVPSREAVQDKQRRAIWSARCVDVWVGEARTCPIQRVMLVCRHYRRTLQPGRQGLGRRDRSRRQRGAEVGGRLAGEGNIRAVVTPPASRRVGRSCELPLPVLLEELATERSAFEDRLDEVVLLQRLGEVLVHLGLDALLAISHHGVRCEGNDGCPLAAEAPLVFANLGRGFEAALCFTLAKEV